nr:MAG TPA: Copper binding octapeptide repeat protein [Caudoviricetes sp.]
MRLFCWLCAKGVAKHHLVASLLYGRACGASKDAPFLLAVRQPASPALHLGGWSQVPNTA